MHAWQTITTTPSTLGESPFWHPQEQMLYWADIAGCKLHRLNAFTSEVEIWGMPSEPGCFAPCASGGFIIALRDRIVRAKAWGGELQTLSLLDHDATTTRSNDGKCDASGRFWVGTMFEPRTSQSAKLWSYSKGDSVHFKQGNAIVANCLAFSPSSKTVYWADTPQHKIWAWDFDLASSAMTNQRVFKQFAPKPEGWTSGLLSNGGYGGRPDGAAVDSQGNLWVAMFEGRRVVQLSPEGVELQSIEAPVTTCTMPAFGGDDMQTLYLTSARHNRSEAELQREPLMGCVFSLRVNAAGMPVNFYSD
ncbi:MAG: SMP-30/gluconolactonase/LRE family protein [Brachymonas sp.]|nr:SMP-30/gluconolactonase/LRE family protein [Brachymonas sp.]